MKKVISTVTFCAMLSTSLWVATSTAGDFSGGKQGTGKVPRAASRGEFSLGDARPIEPLKLAAGEEPRAAPMDEGSLLKSLTARGITADGREVTVEPSEAVQDTVRKELSGGSGGNEKQTSILRKAKDSAAEGGRTVFGDDDRVQITDTQEQPFRTLGLILMKSQSGEARMCSGALIGPYTVLTAAHCIYDYDRGGWLTEFQFVPGANGPNTDDAPYGAYGYETAYVLEGYLENYQGYYASVIPWDLGIITLQDPVGDDLGWMGYSNYDNLGNFTANMAGYPVDKPYGTMWFATCDVGADQVRDTYFEDYCDTAPGMSGSAVYALDGDQRVIVGVNVAVADRANTAVRLNETYIEWVNSLNE